MSLTCCCLFVFGHSYYVTGFLDCSLDSSMHSLCGWTSGWWWLSWTGFSLFSLSSQPWLCWDVLGVSCFSSLPFSHRVDLLSQYALRFFPFCPILYAVLSITTQLRFDVCIIEECVLLPPLDVLGDALRFVAILFLRVVPVLPSSAIPDGIELATIPSSLLIYHWSHLYCFLHILVRSHSFQLESFTTGIRTSSLFLFYSRMNLFLALPIARVISRRSIVCPNR